MKYVLFVEGHTEKKAIAPFLKRWLDPRLPQPVGIQPVRFEGWAEMEKDMERKAQLYLQGPKSGEIIAVVALLDLYGPTFYPGHLHTVEDRYGWAVQDIARKVNQARFRMFFAVHEVEAWLFSKPELFPKEIASKFPGKVQQPETINFDTPPAKLLDAIYYQSLKRHYNKVVNGSDFFKSLDPNDTYQKCPHFAAMMDELLALARQVGL
ncbi:MAG: DUF4276 family protein [Anaerolineaceae bacterium]|nr:DUF4276 family protein [Anaerolineaceae bacterium]